MTVSRPFWAFLNVPKFLHWRIMNAVALPPLPSLLSLQKLPLGVTTTAVSEHRLMPVLSPDPVGGSQAGQREGHESMQKPIWVGSPPRRHWASQSLMQSAQARLAMVIQASPAIDAMNRFMFLFLVVLEPMGSIDESS